MQISTRSVITKAPGKEHERMNQRELPPERVRNNEFSKKGRDDVFMIDVFPVTDGEQIKVTFESVKSPWRQGAWLRTDGYLVVNEQRCPSVQLWQDSAPREIVIECHTQNRCLHIYNIWDRGRGRESQAWSSGMLIEDIPNGRRYHCNDIGFETSFDKLVFRVERT